MQNGYTLIESLVCIATWGIILISINQLLVLMVKTQSPSIQPIEVFKLQLIQLLNRSNNVQLHDQKIYFSYDNKSFELSYDRNRIVKKPGYEILMDDVVTWSIYGGEISVCTKENCQKISTGHDFNTESNAS